MKNIIIILTFLVLGQSCFGQAKNISIPIGQDGDTTLWYNWQQEKYKKAGLKNLLNLINTLHFRFATETQAVDIWTFDYKTFFGSLANFITSYKPNENKLGILKPEKIFTEIKDIDTNKARQIYELFMNDSIFLIPTQESIKNWNSGFDGTTYFIEKSTPTSYSFKEYWEPALYRKNNSEARKIYYMTKSIEKLLGLEHSYSKFIQSLPNGTYNAGGIEITVAKTKKKIE